MATWNLVSGVQIVKLVEPLVRAHNYHTMLGGSVLHRGRSDKDLDLFFCPFQTHDKNTRNIYNLLIAYFESEGATSRRMCESDYTGHANSFYWADAAIITLSDGRRIDVFIG